MTSLYTAVKDKFKDVVTTTDNIEFKKKYIMHRLWVRTLQVN